MKYSNRKFDWFWKLALSADDFKKRLADREAYFMQQLENDRAEDRARFERDRWVPTEKQKKRLEELNK